MKSMTCKQLGGACDKVFSGNTFEEIAAQSKAHGTEMFKAKDPAHMQAMTKMTELMHNPEDMQQWMNARIAEFNAL